MSNKSKPNTNQRNFRIDTVKGIFWYDNIDHLINRLRHECIWLEKLTEKDNKEAIVKQAKLVSQIVEELSRIK